MNGSKVVLGSLAGLSVLLACLLTCFLMLPAISQNSSGEYCSYISEGSKEIANWSAQGQPCRLKWNAILDFFGILFASSFTLFLLFTPLSLLVISIFKKSIGNVE